jgi:hypothetical protein
MDLFRTLVFVHVAAAVGLFVSLSIEWLILRGLGRATSYVQAREWMHVWPLLGRIGVPSALTALASGIYLARLLGMWQVSWVAVAMPTIVAMAILGGTTAPSRKRIAVALGAHDGALPDAVTRQLRHPGWLTASVRIRTALLGGLLFEMTAKPNAGLLAMGLIAVAEAWGLARPVAARLERIGPPISVRHDDLVGRRGCVSNEGRPRRPFVDSCRETGSPTFQYSPIARSRVCGALNVACSVFRSAV